MGLRRELLGGLRARVNAAFAGQLIPAELIRKLSAPGLDPLGDPIVTTTERTAVQAVVDDYSDFFRATAGIPDTDVKLILIGCQQPCKDDIVELCDGRQYQVRSVRTDPAQAHWEARAYQTTCDTGSGASSGSA